jgi:hypothetical protein
MILGLSYIAHKRVDHSFLVGTHNAWVWVWGRTRIGLGERKAHSGYVGQSLQAEDDLRMCDNCDAPENNGYGHEARPRARDESVLLVGVADPGMLAESGCGGLADGNADSQTSVRRRSRVRA